MDNAFRKLPVDSYSEDQLLPTDLYTPDSRGPLIILSETKSKSMEIKQYLQRGSIKEALEIVLRDYPYGEDSDVGEAKVSCVLRV